MTDGVPPRGFRTFAILWATQSLSVLGTALTLFAVNIWLTQSLYPRPEQQKELALALSALSLAFALPTVFVAPLAGARADRHDRKRTMLVMNLASGALSLALLALLGAGALRLWGVVALAAGFSTLNAFHSAAFDTSYAMLVPREQLPRANGMMQTTWAMAGILSPALAAVLIGLPALARQGAVPGALGGALARIADGAVLAIGADAATFLVAAAVLPFLHVPSPRRPDVDAAGRPAGSLWADVRAGAAFLGRRRPLLWLLAAFTAANFALSPVEVLQPLLLKLNLAADAAGRGYSFEAALALLGTAAGAGGVAGGVLVSALGGLRRRRIYGVLAPMLVAGAAQVAYGLSPWLYGSAALALVMTGMVPVMNAHSQSIWQSATPPELQGRVFAVRRVVAQCSWPLSTALAGWAGGRYNPGAFLAVLGAVFFVFCWTQLFNRQLLAADDTAPDSPPVSA